MLFENATYNYEYNRHATAYWVLMVDNTVFNMLFSVALATIFIMKQKKLYGAVLCLFFTLSIPYLEVWSGYETNFKYAFKWHGENQSLKHFVE